MSAWFRSVLRASVVALAAACFAGCGGGSHPPTLSNPRVAPLVPQGWPISPQADFADDGGDVSGARLTLRDDYGGVVLVLEGAIAGAGGARSGWIDFSFDSEGLTCGHYTAEIQLWDGKGSRSGAVTVDFHLVAGFRGAVAYPSAGFGAPWIALGDLDGDGRLDVAAVESGGTRVAAWLQVAGTLAAPRAAEGGLVPSALAAGDVDGDGRAELLVAGRLPGALPGEQARLAVIGIEPATGLPAVEATLPLGDELSGHVAVGDLDGDGRLDVLAARDGVGGPRLVQLLQQPGGGLGTPSPATGVVPGADFVLADVDGNGTLDLAVASGPGEVSVLRRSAPGSGFGLPEVYALVGPISELHAGDLDGRGFTDLIAVTGSQLQLLLGSASGAMSPATSSVSFGGGVFADMDGEGTVELVQPGGDGLAMSCSHDGAYFQWGFGGLSSTGGPPEAIPRFAIAVGEVTGDGPRDVVAARADGSLLVFPHR